jgi:hypothetical protein
VLGSDESLGFVVIFLGMPLRERLEQQANPVLGDPGVARPTANLCCTGPMADVEPASELPLELVEHVATPLERVRYARDLLASRVLFVIVEVAYKATYPLDGQFVDFPYVEVDLDMQSANTRSGHRLRIAWAAAPGMVALSSMSGPIPGLPDGGAVSRCRQDRKVQKLGSRPD